MKKEARKKVLYVITKSVWGGAQKYVHDLATNLPEEYKPMVAGGPPGDEASGRGPMAEKIISSGIPYFEIKSFQRNVNIFKDVFAFFEILSILFKTKPDIIHVSSAKAGGVAGTAFSIYKLLITNYKLLAVFTVHGWTLNEARPKWQIFLIKFFSKITCLFYDKIICVSEYDRKTALENKIAPEKKLITIHNGIKPEDYIFLPKTENWIGTIGEETKNKGHKYLKEAEKHLSNINFKIISNLPDAARYMKNFDIFILPSLKEGLPYVLLEAGLAELPVITTNVGGILEIIENEKDGLLINPAQPQEIAKAVEKLLKDENLRKTLTKNLHQKILQEFSFEKMLNQTITVYNF